MNCGWCAVDSTHPFNGPFSGTTRVSRYQKGKTNLDFTEARDGEWQWHQLGRMQVCTSLQTDNHASTPVLSFLQAECPFCRPTNSVKALKVEALDKLCHVLNAAMLVDTSTQKVLLQPGSVTTRAFHLEIAGDRKVDRAEMSRQLIA